MNDGRGFHFLFGGRFDRHPQAQDVAAIDRFILTGTVAQLSRNSRWNSPEEEGQSAPPPPV
jgi:hypothetical protein